MKTALRFLGFVFLLAVLFVFGFGWRDLQHGSLPIRPIGLLLGGSQDNASTSPEQVFKRTYNKILVDYYKQLKPIELKYAGMSGLMASLGDPHTLFLPPQEAQDFNAETTANFVGIGARLQPDPLGARLVVIFDEGPARAGGLKIGDLIVSVDGKDTVGMAIDDIVGMIRGKEGTPVKLRIIRSGSPKPLVFSIRRAKVITPTVESKFLKDSGVGYVTIASFSEPTAYQFDREMDKLNRQKLNGLVIDLRENPGGLLETAVDMLSRFAENKVVVKMRFRDGHEEIAKTYGGLRRDWSYPVVLLMNENSASAAEIFAGALRDYKMATLVGTHSYGKASVQNVFDLVDRASAKITIAKYFLPSGQDIGRRVDADGQYTSGGLAPDVKATVDPDTSVIGDPKRDPQLAKALDVIRSKR